MASVWSLTHPFIRREAEAQSRKPQPEGKSWGSIRPLAPQLRTAVTCLARAGSPVAHRGEQGRGGRGRSRGGLEPQRLDLAFFLESRFWLQEVGRGAGRGEASPHRLAGAQSPLSAPFVTLPVPPCEDLKESQEFWRDRMASGVHPEGLTRGDLGSSALL